ncbi:MAG TPA: DUF58 domain-containing protein [Anaerolineaceae bacterium]|nr:DUF58 domain-containing protein [Anaerolineaceae bacterium]
MNLGLWLFVLAVMLIVGTLLNLKWLVFFVTTVGFLLAITHLWRKHSLDQVQYRRKWIYTRGFPGETADVQLEVENRKRLPVSWLKAVDNWPVAAPPVERDLLSPSHLVERGFLTNIFSLRGFQRAHRTYRFRFDQRGIHPIGPVRLESGDLFGLFEEAQTLEPADQLTVFPEVLPLESLRLPAEDPFGDRQAPRRLFEDPNRTIGVRGYHPEDEMRRIHWPATARTGSMQVRLYQPVSARVLMVCLNVSTSEHIWQGTASAPLEQIVKIAATICYHGMEDGYSVGLISNGGLARSDRAFKILPSRSPNHLALLLQALAGVSPITIAPFENYLLKTMPDVPLGATLLVVTPLVTTALAETLVALRRYRAHTTLISIAPEPPPEIPGVRSIHLPFEEAVG